VESAKLLQLFQPLCQFQYLVFDLLEVLVEREVPVDRPRLGLDVSTVVRSGVGGISGMVVDEAVAPTWPMVGTEPLSALPDSKLLMTTPLVGPAPSKVSPPSSSVRRIGIRSYFSMDVVPREVHRPVRGLGGDDLVYSLRVVPRHINGCAVVADIVCDFLPS
jgi:hypothetical protein